MSLLFIFILPILNYFIHLSFEISEDLICIWVQDFIKELEELVEIQV